MRRALRPWLMVFVVSLSFGGVAWADEAPATGKVHRIKIRAMAFDPPLLTVGVGDTVTWINEDFVPHTATAAKGTRPAFDSGTLAPKASWSLVVTTPGELAYLCTLHPTMKAVVRVR